jgi:flagellar protein FlaH
MSSNRTKKKVISTGNEELDLKLPGGLPYPSLIFIEGAHGTAKTVLTQQFLYGMLKENLRALVFTTETTTKDYVKKMSRVGLDITKYFLKDRVRVYSTQMLGVSWSKQNAAKLLPLLGDYILENKEKFDAFIIDSLSHLAIYSTPTRVLDFFNKIRVLTDEGKMVIVTLHEGVLREDLVIRARALCDGYIKLSTATIGGRIVKVMRIIKLRGAPTTFDTSISFDIDPAFGVKIVPIALAKA